MLLLTRFDATSGVNFINVLHEAFTNTYPKSYKKLMTWLSFLCIWDLCVKKLQVKCWWNWPLSKGVLMSFLFNFFHLQYQTLLLHNNHTLLDSDKFWLTLFEENFWLIHNNGNTWINRLISESLCDNIKAIQITKWLN